MRSARQDGFSLLELIVVVTIVGLLAVGGGMLVLTPIEAYDAQVRRQRLVDQGEMALRQIARDVRRALPNSVRITPVGTGWAVEMVNTIDGARYRDEIGGDFTSVDDTLEFGAADDNFNLLGNFNGLGMGLLTGGERLVIYNTSADAIYGDAAANNNPGIVTTAGTAITLSPTAPPSDDPEQRINLAPPFQFAQQSPGQRVFVVDGPTSYICEPASGRITRYTGYAFAAGQPTPPVGGTSDTVISQLAGCNMSYSPGTSQRGGILTVEINIDDSGESVDLLHQIHVVNVP